MSRRLPNMMAHLMLVALIIQAGWSGGQWTWRLVWPQTVSVGMAEGTRDTGSATARIQPDELSFFGRRKVREGRISDVVRETAPETGLTLALLGVFIAAQNERSSAILSGNGRPAQLYEVGDRLPGGAELVAVERKRILLKRNGEVETLSFEDDGLSMDRVAAMPRSRGDREAFVERGLEALEEDPREALASVGFRPNDDGPGYVYDGTNERLSGMNLQPGDVIISINGQQLGDVKADRERLGRWLASNSLQLEIKRGGTRFSFTVPVP